MVTDLFLFDLDLVLMLLYILCGLPSSHGVNTSELATNHSTCNSESDYLSNSEGESLGTVVNSDCFNDYDPSLLGNVDPDINYLNPNNNVKNIIQ